MAFLPSKCRRYLYDKGWVFNEIENDKQKGIILRDFLLPADRYDAERADILIILPPNYPDVPPDMFYAHPFLKLKEGDKEPRATNARHQFADRTWQRWSRHAKDWRPGIDGIWTMLKRVETALEGAT